MVNLKPLAPLTPVLFSTTYIKGDLHEKHPTFLGIFDRPYQEGAGVILPERIKGIFSDPPEKPGFITFEWNPGTIFKYPVKSTLLRSHFPSVIFNTPVSLWFSLRPPHRNAANQTVYPFPKEIKAETPHSLTLPHPPLHPPHPPPLCFFPLHLFTIPLTAGGEDFPVGGEARGEGGHSPTWVVNL